jgi:hypothetical protein
MCPACFAKRAWSKNCWVYIQNCIYSLKQGKLPSNMTSDVKCICLQPLLRSETLIDATVWLLFLLCLPYLPQLQTPNIAKENTVLWLKSGIISNDTDSLHHIEGRFKLFDLHIFRRGNYCVPHKLLFATYYISINWTDECGLWQSYNCLTNQLNITVTHLTYSYVKGSWFAVNHIILT